MTVFVRKQKAASREVKHTQKCSMVKAYRASYIEVRAVLVNPAIPVCARCRKRVLA